MKSFGPSDYICLNHFSNDQYYNPNSSNQSVRLFSTAVPHPMPITVNLNVEMVIKNNVASIENIFKDKKRIFWL